MLTLNMSIINLFVCLFCVFRTRHGGSSSPITRKNKPDSFGGHCGSPTVPERGSFGGIHGVLWEIQKLVDEVGTFWNSCCEVPSP